MSRVAMRGGPSTSAPSDGSRTITIRDSQPREEGDENGPNVSDGGEEVGRIRLQGGRSRPRVVWSEDVVDNEHMGKKSSKICCIYHRPKRFDESSSSDESSDESDSSCDGHDHSHASGSRRRHRHAHRPESPNNNGNADGGANLRSREGGETVVHEVESDSDERNAYERPPRRKKGKGVARNANEA